MSLRLLFIALLMHIPLLPTVTATAANQDSKSLQLFGVALKGATRDQLRQAFKKNGMRPTREDSAYWVDTYDAEGVLDGASDFKAGYVAATGKFAYAEYTFAAFMNTAMVGKVISMVTTKYGPPSSRSGNVELGPVTAKWSLGQGTQIEVSRGWPNTTTYLTFKDSSAYKQMQTEIDAERSAQEREKVKSQSEAF